MANFYEALQHHIDHAVVKRITKHYQLPEPKGSIRFFVGWQNATFTFRAGQRRYVARLYRHRARTRKEILRELAVISFLASKHLPVAAPIANIHGKPIHKITVNGMWLNAVLFPYRPGEPVGEITQNQVTTLGQLLGEFHTKLATYQPGDFTKHWRPKRDIDTIDAQLTDRLANRSWPYVDIAKKSSVILAKTRDMQLLHDAVTQHLFSRLPTQIIHADFHPSNLKYQDNTISGLFDFDSIMKAPKIVDIAITIVRLRMNQSGLAPGKAKPCAVFPLVITAYKQTGTLTQEEENLLLLLIRFFTWKEMVWILAETENVFQLRHHSYMFGQCWHTLNELPASNKRNP